MAALQLSQLYEAYDVLDKKIREHTRKPLPWEELHLIYTEDEADKSVVGGAIYARRKLNG